MPIYEFECKSCKEIFEKIISIREDSSNIRCPKCSKLAKKLISRNRFILSGGCWASDGYSSKKQK